MYVQKQVPKKVKQSLGTRFRGVVCINYFRLTLITAVRGHNVPQTLRVTVGFLAVCVGVVDLFLAVLHGFRTIARLSKNKLKNN